MRVVFAERPVSQNFEQLKLEIGKSIVHSVTKEPMVLEMDASDYAIAAITFAILSSCRTYSLVTL